MSKSRQGMTAKSFNKFLYIMSGCILMVTVAIGIYAGMLLDKLSKEVSQNNYVSINNNKKIEALAELSTDYNKVEKEGYMVDSYIPDDKEVSTILRDLENIAKSKSLTFTTYRAIEDKKAKTEEKKDTTDIQIKKQNNYYIFPFQLELTGSYDGINSMIMEMEDFDRLIDIKTISYEKDENEALVASDIIKATLAINVYLIK